MNCKHPKGWICVQCGDPSQKHMARGLCAKCYQANYRRTFYKTRHFSSNRPCRICGTYPVTGLNLCKACYMKQYRKANRSRLYARKCQLREVDRFGGRRNEILKRADGKCERCGITEVENVTRTGKRLIIHHKDGNGLSSPNPNHSFDNLMLVCNSCHRKIHGEIGIREAS